MVDAISKSTQAIAAAQNTDDPEMAVVYVGVARNALTEAQEQCRQLSIIIGAREKEIARLAKLAKGAEMISAPSKVKP